MASIIKKLNKNTNKSDWASYRMETSDSVFIGYINVPSRSMKDINDPSKLAKLLGVKLSLAIEKEDEEPMF